MHSPDEKVKLVDRESFESAIGLSSVKQELNPNPDQNLNVARVKNNNSN